MPQLVLDRLETPVLLEIRFAYFAVHAGTSQP
jgi:hypothetical protein